MGSTTRPTHAHQEALFLLCEARVLAGGEYGVPCSRHRAMLYLDQTARLLADSGIVVPATGVNFAKAIVAVSIGVRDLPGWLDHAYAVCGEMLRPVDEADLDEMFHEDVAA